MNVSVLTYRAMLTSAGLIMPIKNQGGLFNMCVFVLLHAIFDVALVPSHNLQKHQDRLQKYMKDVTKQVGFDVDVDALLQ